ncbi:MAG: type IV pilus assembly protein PilM [Eubacteriaceae bacterium]|nr:type IV pilus assembly protein PilM [Eubacteriaceae bacterium]
MFGNNNSVTVFDFGSKNSKMIQTHFKDKTIVVDFYEIVPTPEDAIKDGKIADYNKLVNIMTTMVKKAKGKGNDNRLVLSSSEVVIRSFDLPKMEYGDLKEAVKFEMAVLLPEKIEHYVVDCSVSEEFMKINDEGNEVKMYQVQAVAVSKRIVNDYLDAMNKVGAKISVVDVQSNCEIKLFTSGAKYFVDAQGNTADEKNVAIIDFGHQKTSVTILEDNKVFLHRVLHTGGRDLTKIISEALDLPLDEAENWKHNNDFAFLRKNAMNEVESILYDEITKVFHDITMEIYQVIEFFISMSKRKKLDSIYLIGGGSLIPGIGEYIQQYINVHTEVVSKLSNVNFSKLEKSSDLAFLSDCLGAAIRRG